MTAKEVTLQILEEDFKGTFYSRSKDCAITRALHRAGFPNLYDAGTDITDVDNNFYCDYKDKDYDELGSIVEKMYSGRLPVRSFKHTITLKFIKNEDDPQIREGQRDMVH